MQTLAAYGPLIYPGRPEQPGGHRHADVTIAVVRT
jgi:hypothetical protein